MPQYWVCVENARRISAPQELQTLPPILPHQLHPPPCQPPNILMVTKKGTVYEARYALNRWLTSIEAIEYYGANPTRMTLGSTVTDPEIICHKGVEWEWQFAIVAYSEKMEEKCAYPLPFAEPFHDHIQRN